MNKRLCWVVAVLLLLLPGKQINAASRCRGILAYISSNRTYVCHKCGAVYSYYGDVPDDGLCAASVDPVCTHTWVPGGTASAHEKCSMCGATQGGHSLVPAIIQNHSCTTSEVTRYSCSCGYYTDTTTKAATGHNSLNRVCNRNGTDTLSCSNCGGNAQVVGCVHNITVTLNADTNGGTPIGSLAPVVGQAFTLPEATKAGWEFVGWSPSATAISGRKGEVSYRTDTTLYAIFKKLLTLRCRDALGDNNQSETIYNNERSASIKLPQISDTDGWEAVGWTTVTEAKPSSTLAADTTIEVR